MSAQIIPLPRPRPGPAKAGPDYRHLYWLAQAWVRADKTKEDRIHEIMASATPAPSMPGEADILKLLRRIDRKLSALSQETPHQKARIK